MEIESLLTTLCECDAEIDVSCHYCIIAIHLKKVTNERDNLQKIVTGQRKEVAQARVATKAAHILVSQYRGALNEYYHLIYKGCPCLRKTGPCESIYQEQKFGRARVVHTSDDGEVATVVDRESA